MPSRPTQSAPASVERIIVETGAGLAQSFSRLLTALPGHPHRPQLLARTLGVNTVLTSRLLRAAREADPMVVAHAMPGPEPLRRLLRAAERKKISSSLITEARVAVDRFEELIKVHAGGDRSALNAMISGWLPDAREKVELLAKQAIFRGMSHILGIECDAEHYTAILYPSRVHPGRADQLWLIVTRGLRRTRPGVLVKYEANYSTTPMQTIYGDPLTGSADVLLEQFCSEPTPKLEGKYLDDRAEFELRVEGVGLQSAVDLAYAVVMVARREVHREASQPPRKMTVSVGITMPSRCLIFDLLVHDELFPGQHPTLHVYRTGVRGVVDPTDASFDNDRLEIIESIQPLGYGIAGGRATENPLHLEMLQFVCSQLQWDDQKLRGYRCRIEYPICDSQILQSFELPEKIGGTSKSPSSWTRMV